MQIKTYSTKEANAIEHLASSIFDEISEHNQVAHCGRVIHIDELTCEFDHTDAPITTFKGYGKTALKDWANDELYKACEKLAKEALKL